MLDPTLIFVGVVFALAGFVKGVIGLGLPTISMGLLTVVMPPVQAAAILILPSLVTNVWQMVPGPALPVVMRRLWPMMLAVWLGTWAGLGLMTGATARFGTTLLGCRIGPLRHDRPGRVPIARSEGMGGGVFFAFMSAPTPPKKFSI
jgi:uncharacterized protein